MSMGDLPVATFRERFLDLERREKIDALKLAERLDWFLVGGTPDAQRVRRTLGLQETQRRNGYKAPREKVTFAMAKRLADAMDIDYHEVGL